MIAQMVPFVFDAPLIDHVLRMSPSPTDFSGGDSEPGKD